MARKKDTKEPVESATATANVKTYQLKFKVAKQVSLPSWKWEPGTPKLVKFESEIADGKEAKTKKEGVDWKQMRVAKVTDLETNTVRQVSIGTVLEGILTDNYPKNAYVGKCFQITQSLVPGKRYKNYEVAEIEVEG